MLIQFNFKNYKSFKDEATLDLSAAKMTEFSERVINVANDRILPIAAIYGANASGKSNVYRAFEYMSNYVVHSFKYGDESESYKGLRPTPFKFSRDTENAETSFEVYFTIPGDDNERTYNYGFCIDDNGISEEWLNSKAKTARKFSTIFYRDKETLDLSGLPRSSRDNIEAALEKQVLVVSLGAKLRVAKCKLIRDWFLKNEFADRFSSHMTGKRVNILEKKLMNTKQMVLCKVSFYRIFQKHHLLYSCQFLLCFLQFCRFMNIQFIFQYTCSAIAIHGLNSCIYIIP